jgi:hypothetical protein
LPFDLAQGGGELVEPFGICVLLFEIFNWENLKLSFSDNMLLDKSQ